MEEKIKAKERHMQGGELCLRDGREFQCHINADPNLVGKGGANGSLLPCASQGVDEF